MMSAVLANRIVEAWDKDKISYEVPGLLEYLEEHKEFQPIKMRVRAMLAQANPKASDLLWDKNVRSAIIALRKYGLVEHKRVFKPTSQVHYLGSARLSGQSYAPEFDWKYVKSVRSK